MTPTEARFKLDSILQERRLDGRCADILDLDVILCEDGETVMVMFDLDDGSTQTFCFDRPAGKFDRRAIYNALMTDQEATVH
jgi:hypothetical protein